MENLFHAFTFCGRKLLAVKQEGGVYIIADNGDIYGAWVSIDSFKKSQDWGKHPSYNWERMCLGAGQVSVRIL